MKAIILAAGAGTRLRPYTTHRPKCLVKIGGLSILDRQLNVLRRAGVEDITIVSGYRAPMVKREGCETVRNLAYARTNMVASLMCARHKLWCDDDMLVIYGDIIFEPRVLAPVMASSSSLSVAVDTCWRAYWEKRMVNPLQDAETLKMDPQGLITEIGDRPTSYRDIEGQYIGLFKIGAGSGRRFLAAYDSLDPTALYRGRQLSKMYMTDFLQELADQGWPVQAVLIQNGWLEFDSREDLECVEAMNNDRTLIKFCDVASTSV